MYGANYVEILQAKFPTFKIVNCGSNGEVLESIHRRLEPALKAYNELVVGVIVLGGTNDVLANLNGSTHALIQVFNPFLRELPPLAEYPTILRKMLATIYAHKASPFIDICVITPPMVGEIPDSTENLVVDSVCDVIRTTVREFTTKKEEEGAHQHKAPQESRGTSMTSGQLADALHEDAGSDAIHHETDNKSYASQQHRPRSPHHPGPHPPRKTKKPPRVRRRLHCVDFNARMKKHFESHYADKKRKAFEPAFVNMCFNSSVGLVGGTVLHDWNAVSEARGMALHVDCVHMNEKAIALLVDALSVWLENLQEEVYLEATKAAYAAASPRKSSSASVGRLSDSSLAFSGLTLDDEKKEKGTEDVAQAAPAKDKEAAVAGPSGAGTVTVVG